MWFILSDKLIELTSNRGESKKSLQIRIEFILPRLSYFPFEQLETFSFVLANQKILGISYNEDISQRLEYMLSTFHEKS